MSKSEEIYSQWVNGGFERIARALESDEEETQHLDFKEHPKFADRSSQSSDKWQQVFGKAASGFANSEGGVLVWGIEAKNRQPLKDARIPNVQEFYRELLDLTITILEPKLEGIEHHSILHPDGDGSGYVVSHVPRGDLKPYMSTARDHNKYFFRMSSSTGAMAHDQIRGFFFARSRPELDLFLKKRMSRPGIVTIRATLKNSGAVIAERCAVAFEREVFLGSFDCLYNSPTYGNVEIESDGVPRSASLVRMISDFVLYPGMSHDMLECEVDVSKLPDPRRPRMIAFWMFADGFSLRREFDFDHIPEKN